MTSDQSAQMLNVLAEMRDLLRLIAEPTIAQRDKKPREALRSMAGSATGKKAKAILLMEGTRNQAGIANDCGIDRSDLSALVKRLEEGELLKGDRK
jgi:DNA-binding MarR family transcriptional regulator